MPITLTVPRAEPLPVARSADKPPAATFEQLVGRHQAGLVRYAARLLGDSDRARDVVQDAFARLLAQPRGSLQGHEAEWLFTVCRHRALDVLRRDERMIGMAPAEADRLPGMERRPGYAMEAAESQAIVRGLLEALPANQQEVIRLKFQNGFSYKEIARITDLSVGNVGFLIHTGVARLRREFAE